MGLPGIVVGEDYDSILAIDAGTFIGIAFASIAIEFTFIEQVIPFIFGKCAPTLAKGGNQIRVHAPVDESSFIILIYGAGIDSPVGDVGTPSKKITGIFIKCGKAVGLMFGKTPSAVDVLQVALTETNLK